MQKQNKLSNNRTIQLKRYEKISLNYRPSNLRDYLSKRYSTRGIAIGIGSVKNKLIRFKDIIYIGRYWLEYVVERYAISMQYVYIEQSYNSIYLNYDL